MKGQKHVLMTFEFISYFRMLKFKIFQQIFLCQVGRQVSDILAFDVQHDIDRYGLTGRAVHDACIAASILRPELFTFKKMNVSVDLTCEPTIGACIFDENAVIEENDGIWVAESIQSDHVFDLIIELMKSY